MARAETLQKGVPIGRVSKMHAADSRFAHRLIIPLAVFLIALVAFPLVYSIVISFMDVDLEYREMYWVGGENYAEAVGDDTVRRSVLLTLQYTALTAAFTLGVGLGGALLLNKPFKGRRFAMTVWILPWGVSLYSTGIAWRYIVGAETGMFNMILYRLGIIPEYIDVLNIKSAMFLVSVAHAWQLAPLAMYFFLATMLSIPEVLYRSARLDRLGAWGRFRNVTVPYLRLPFTIVMIVVIMEAAKGFDVIYFLSQAGPASATQVMTYETYKESFMNLYLGYGSAIGWMLNLIVIGIVIVFLLVLGRYARGATA